MSDVAPPVSVPSIQPAVLAPLVIRNELTTDDEHTTAVYWRGTWMIYTQEGGWKPEHPDWLPDFLLRKVDQKYVVMPQDPDGVPRPWRFGITAVKEMDLALKTICRIRDDVDVPSWRSGRAIFDSRYCVAFQDAIVSVADEEVDVRTRTAEWFDTMTLPVEFDPHAECPTWQACVREWSCGIEGWAELLQEWMGYCLLPTNEYAKWMFMMGRPRSGKGTITKILELLMGNGAYMGVSLYDFGGSFGLHGLETARALIVNEVSELEKRSAERAVQVIKSILGQDSISIDRKHRDMLRNVRVDTTVTMVSNQMIELPNRGQGLGSKMLVLPFRGSWVGHEDFRLIQKLKSELPGIAAWAVEGAHRLVRSDGRFTEVPEAVQEQDEFRHTNNPLDVFLDARFLARSVSWTSSHMVWTQYVQWCESVGEQPVYTNRTLIRALLRESTWNLERRQRSSDGLPRRGLQGLALRRYHQDNPEL